MIGSEPGDDQALGSGPIKSQVTADLGLPSQLLLLEPRGITLRVFGKILSNQNTDNSKYNTVLHIEIQKYRNIV